MKVNEQHNGFNTKYLISDRLTVKLAIKEVMSRQNLYLLPYSVSLKAKF